jgi:hypothetical protein
MRPGKRWKTNNRRMVSHQRTRSELLIMLENIYLYISYCAMVLDPMGKIFDAMKNGIHP